MTRSNSSSRLSSKPVGKWRVRVGPLMALPDVLTEAGVNAAELLEEVGLTAADFADPEGTIPFATGDAMLSLGAKRSGCEHLGLLVGERAPAQSMGTVGYLMLSSATVGQALQALTRHLDMHDRGAVVALREEEGVAILSYSLLVPGLKRPDQILALSIAVGRNILRGLCGPQWRPLAVSFAFARPKRVAPYQQCFGLTPQFDAPESALIFPAQQLMQPLPGADRFLHHLMRERVQSAARGSFDDLVELVRGHLRARRSVEPMSLAEVAAQIGLHEKTLSRHLAARGTSFRIVREEVLFENAKDLLRGTRLAMGEIASALGYADPSVFSRAFRRWSGLAPSRWRQGAGDA